MRRVATAIAKSWARITRALAYYPLGFYLGLLLIVAAAFLYWAQTDLGWKFDWVQLQRWISNHAMAILALFTGLLGLVLIGSAIAYKQVIDLSKQEYVLWLHQRATKVLFPVFSPLHDWIRLRSRIYHWWHAQSFSNVTHYFLLIIAIGGLAKTTVNYISSAQASHGCSDAVTITVNTTWSTNQCHGDVVVRNGATLTINGGVIADLSSLSVGSDSPAENGFITAKGDTLNNLGVVLNVDGAVYVRASSSINADAQGYLGGRSGDVNGKGPGGATTDGTSTAGGGGYGGAGSNGSGSNAGGSSYGTLAAPVDLGSGGGFATGCCSNNGGDGGGAVKINAPSSTVTINGTISANGSGGGAGCCAYAGGGSGGSVWVVANTLTGSGEVRANGGAGGSGGAGESNNGGAGAGGRIQLTFSSDTSTITKYAYDGGNNGANRRGASGTISTSSELIIANNASPTILPTVATPLSGSLSYSSTTIKDNAYVTLASGANLSGGTTLIQNNTKTTLLANNTLWSGGALTVQTGANVINVPNDVATEPSFSSINVGTGTLQHDSHTTTHIYSLILSTTGSATITGTINVDDKGYAGGTSGSANGKGPGGGLDGSSNDAPGAGHGGTGGNGATVNGGASYGNLSSPTDLGSGGGGTSSSSFNNGGNGGGAVKITASSGTVTVNGTITANGSTGFSACCNYAGGGSGGSIWIIANTLAGSGTVRANGGAGGSGGAGDASNGGAGAGGRVQFTFTTNSSTLTREAFDGGNNAVSRRAAAGTISTSAELIIANNAGTTVVPAVATPLSGSLSYGSTTIKDYVHVTLASGANYSGGTTLIQNNTKTTLLANNTVWSGGALTVQTGTNTINVPKSVSTEPSFSSIAIGTGTVNHNDHSTAHDYSVILAASGNVTVTGNVTLDGLGFDGGRSGDVNGKGSGGAASNGTTTAGGGGYGGTGSNGVSPNLGGNAYGSFTQPTDLGSGGGGTSSSSFNNGGDGGGAIKINAPSGTVTINGTISTNGSGGFSACCNYAGGGSGGSIWIIANTLAGSGTVRANGGAGGSGGAGDASNGGAGAGGRIQLTFSSDTSSITKLAFDGGNNGANRRGAAGTVSTSSSLTIANSSLVTIMPTVSTPISGTLNYPATNIKDYVYVTLAAGANLSGGTTTIENNTRTTLLGDDTVWTGGALTVQTSTNTINVKPTITTKPLFSSINFTSGNVYHDDHTATDNYHIILSATGNITVGTSINLTGLGFSGGVADGTGNGPGPGVGASTQHAGGGAHGGNGGAGASNGGAGGTAYGSAVAPVTLGSGGGGAQGIAGGDGGGAIQLSAGGTLAINSAIITSGSDGSVGCCSYFYGSGGGGGGSIFLAANSITGSAALTANGGNGGNGSNGGCGGGGRIARHYTSSTYSGTVSVVKGSGSCAAGQNGTNQLVGTVTDLIVTGISTPRTAGVTSSVVVEARDASNNRNYAYTKAITFTSTDSQATLPGNYTFTIADAGLATIPGVVLKTAGTQTVTADQTDDGTVDGTHANITVNAGSVTNFVVSGVTDPVAAGTSTSPTVTAKDAYTNTVSGYTGTVTFTSSDSQATLPANYAFVGGDAGVKTFTNGVVLKTAGEHTLTATDTVTSSITGTQSNITVNAATASSIVLSGITSPTTAGAGHSPTATIKDTYNNTVTNYTGTIVFNSSDSQATLPTNYTFVGGDAGVKTFTNGVVLKTTGVHSITASDGTINGTIQNINVTAGQPTKLKVSNITSPIAANTPSSPTVTVQDQYNNTATGYTGTIAFSSSDAAATLPSNYAFSVSNQGVRTFTNVVTFATGGTHSLTATDVSSPTINGTLSSIVVTAAASTGGTSQPGVTNQPSLTIVLIQPSEGTFFGTITQQVNGLPLEVTVTGTVKGNQINGTVSGTYNEQPVTGTITGTVKGQKIESAILTLFNANDPGFNLTVVVGGVISPPDSPKQEPDCKLRGTLELTIDGKKFSGEVQLTISPDGSVTGRAKGFLDNDRVFGTFSASSVEGRLIGGTVTLTSNNNNSPITGEIIGSVRDGEIQLTNAEHCNISTDIVIDTDEDGDADGEGTGNVEIDEPVSSSDIINGSIIGTVEGQTANEDVIVNGLFEALVSDVVIKPTELKFETNEQNDLISGALAVVSGLSVLPILPAVQNILLTSSTRGFTFIHWFFFGYTPRKRRKFWGVIKDKTTGVPVAGVLVKLVDVHSNRVINQYRTDKTGRYGFLVETVGDYRITIIDPLYAAFSSKEFSVDNLKQPIVTGDIQLTPVHQRQLRILNKTLIWVAAIKILNIIHWPLLIGGTILSVMLVADHPTTLRTLIASLYSVLWLSKLLGYRRERHYGQVTDGDGAPLARAVVQLTNQSGETTAHVHSTVTDANGRFVLLVKPGVYTVIVAKDGYKTRQGAVIADEANMTIRLERAEA